MGNIILGFANVLEVVLDIYKWIIIIRALISWVNPDPYNPIVQALTRLTEPVLRPLRKLAPPYKVGVDLSPLIAVLILLFLDYALIANLKQFAYGLR